MVGDATSERAARTKAGGTQIRSRAPEAISGVFNRAAEEPGPFAPGGPLMLPIFAPLSREVPADPPTLPDVAASLRAGVPELEASTRAAEALAQRVEALGTSTDPGASRNEGLLGFALAWLGTTALGSLVAAQILFGARLPVFAPQPPYVVKVVQGPPQVGAPGPCPISPWQPPVVAVTDLPRARWAAPAPPESPVASAVMHHASVAAVPAPREPTARAQRAAQPKSAPPPATLEDFIRRAVETDSKKKG